jgi:hypothetical protein
LRFQWLLTDPTPIVRCNLIARLSSHRSCIRSHRLPLNRPSRLHLEIKNMKCVLYELLVDWAMNSGHDALPSPEVNPLEGSPMWSCGIGTRKGAPDSQHYKGVEGRARSPGIRLGRRTSRSSLILHPKQTTKWLVHIREHPWYWDKPRALWTTRHTTAQTQGKPPPSPI